MPFKPAPTWINREYVGGPIFHYRSVSDADAISLGINPLPSAEYGSVINISGARARRLRSGLINVEIPHSSILMREDGFAGFLDRMIKSDVNVEDPPEMPVVNPWDHSASGEWRLDMTTQNASWNAAQLGADGVRQVEQAEGMLDCILMRVEEDDRNAVRQALLSSIIFGGAVCCAFKATLFGGRKLIQMIGRHGYEGLEHVIGGQLNQVAVLPPGMPEAARASAAGSAAKVQGAG